MGDSAIQVNQMDLLSGIPTILAIVAGLVQIWPSPAKVYKRHLVDFVVWLKTGIEKDFCASLHLCEKKCMTQLYDANFDMIQKRIRINIGDTKEVGCVGDSMIPAEELVEIAQRNNNGPLLIELAKAVRYPKIKTLARAVTILGYAPSFGKSVTFFQWAVVIAAYTLSWLFVGGFPNFPASVFNFCHNVLRRLCGFGPILPASPHILTPDEQMAELARHRVISEHIPWVRYGVYHLIANLAGKQPSVRVLKSTKW
ncbi:hypothetical protein LPJ56_003440 [Coemansia sp. RSA 2599]|nr:hypothetical protein LPJ75_003204 [Coemansia sp. RSA 2598]KAJ1820424.1 hypothetical protein LPJ56_003440 [Coemansia sp. RSA 2599]